MINGDVPQRLGRHGQVLLTNLGRAGLLVACVLGAPASFGGSSSITAQAPFQVVATGFEQPTGLAIHPQGFLVLTDQKTGVLYRLTPAVTAVGQTALASKVLFAGLDEPIGVAVEPDGHLLVAERDEGRLVRFTNLMGSSFAEPEPVAKGLKEPRWLAVDGEGTIFVSTNGIKNEKLLKGMPKPKDEVLLKVTPEGSLTVLADGFKELTGLALDPAGHLFAGAKRQRGDKEKPDGTIFKIPLPDGPASPVIAGGFKGPQDPEFDVLGALFFTANEYREGKKSDDDDDDRGETQSSGDREPDGRNEDDNDEQEEDEPSKPGKGVILKATFKEDGTLDQLKVFAAGLGQPMGLSFDPDGHLYVAERKHGRVLRFEAPAAPTLESLPPITNKATLTVQGHAEPNAQITILGGASPATGLADATTGAFAVEEVTLKPNTEQTLKVFATKARGDGLPSRAREATITHDDNLPDTMITGGPSGTINTTTVTFTFTATEAGSTFQCQLNQGQPNPGGFAACTSPKTYTGLTAGSYTFEVRAIDQAGNEGPPAERTFTVVTGPTITGFSPTSGPIGTAVTISGQNFDPAAGNNQVTFNNVAAIITSATGTTLTTTAPQGATTGLIAVTTPQGTATSEQAFTVTLREDFILSAVPAQGTVLQSGQASYALNVTGIGTFTGLVALGVAGLPTGVMAQFSSPTLTAGQTAILTLTASATAPVGLVPMTLNGTAQLETGPKTETIPLTLNVLASGGQTAVSGQFLSTQGGTPIPNVRVNIGTIQAVTDAAGTFLLQNVSSGLQQLMISGTLSNGGFSYATDITLAAGRTNVLQPFWITPQPPPERFTTINNASADQVFTDPRFPGVSMTLPAGVTIIGWDNVPKTKIAIERMDLDRLGVPPPPKPVRSVYQPFFGTPMGGFLSPAGSVIRVSVPNDLGLDPGEQTELWVYDASPLGGPAGWKMAGLATVNDDGTKIVSNPGVGITRFCFKCGLFTCIVPNLDRLINPVPGGSTGGEPVDLRTGLFTVQKTDLVLPGRFPINLSRTYNPFDPFGGIAGAQLTMGRGWALSVDVSLVQVNPAGTLFRVVLPGNSRLDLVKQPNGTWVNSTHPLLKGAMLSTAPGGHQLRFKDGTTWRFAVTGLIELLIEQTDRNGNRVTIERSASSGGMISRILDAAGRALTVTSSGSRITEIRDPLGRAVQYTYGANNRLATVTDPAGGVTSYTYDSAGRILTITDARGIQFIENFYGPSGRVLRQVQADGGEWRFRYQTTGGTVVGPGCPSLACPTEDSWENLQAAYTFIGGGTVMATTVIDPHGKAATHRFNNSGFDSEQADALGQKTTVTRDAGNLVTASTDALGRQTTFTYDAVGNVTSITDPDNKLTQFEYEPTFNRVTKVTDALNHVTAFTYDANGNLLTTTDPLNHTTTIAYNEFGQPISVTDPLDHTTRFEYDQNGNLITTTDPEGNTTRRTYDAVSRLLSLTDPRGFTTQFAYDGLNRVTKITDALNGLTTFAYDPNGNLTAVTDAENHTTTYTYDLMDRLATRKDALNRQESYQYDPPGNLTQFTDRKQQASAFTYDTLNRRIGASFADGSTVSFVYDSVGRLSSALDSVVGRIDFIYDTLDRLIQEISPQGSVTYTYDALGRRITMTVNGQQPVSYGYDAASRLVQVQQGSLTVGLGYDAAGRRTSLTYPNGTSTSYTYDTASRLTNILHQGPAGVIESLSYTYDGAGNRISLTRTNGTATLLPAAVQAAYDAANQQIQFNAASPNQTFDANGNLISDGANTYTWDPRNRLVSISGPGLSASFSYDALGRRISKTINGVNTQYLSDGNDIVQEIEGSAVGTSYLRSLTIDDPLIRQAPANEFYHTDALGSTLALSTVAGASTVTYSYEAFGRTTITGTSTNPFQYTGRENDGTGLYYYRTRYYSTTLGRFLSEDPRGLLGGDANIFAYVRNNPIRFVDPLGLKKRTAPASTIPLVFVGVQISGFFGELFPSGSKSAGAGTEFTLGLVIDPNTGAIKPFKSVGVARRDDPEDIVGGASIGLGGVVGLFGGRIGDFFGEATEETLTAVAVSFTRIETPSGKIGASGGVNFGGSFTVIRTFTSPLFGP